jgi:hypothetical protein
MNKKPKHFLLFKILGFLGVAAGIFGAILSISNFGNFDNNYFMIGGFISTAGLFIGISCLVIGFSPEISSMSVKSAKYIQQETKDDLKDIADSSADIAANAVSRLASAAKDGISPQKKYCKHCGTLIDADSKYCNRCGKPQ